MKTESEVQPMLNKILDFATNEELNGLFLSGNCKVKARFSNHDGPIAPMWSKPKEVILYVSKRIVPNNKRGYINWMISVNTVDWAEYSDVCSEVYSDDIGITLMAEEYRMNIMEVL